MCTGGVDLHPKEVAGVLHLVQLLRGLVGGVWPAVAGEAAVADALGKYSDGRGAGRALHMGVKVPEAQESWISSLCKTAIRLRMHERMPAKTPINNAAPCCSRFERGPHFVPLMAAAQASCTRSFLIFRFVEGSFELIPDFFRRSRC